MKKVLTCLFIVLLLVGCGQKENFKITKTEAASLEYETYDNGIFSLEMPKGWQVSYGGNGMLFAIHAFKPEENDSPKYHVFALLKAEPMYSYGFKEFQKNNFGSFAIYDLLTNAPAIGDPKVENFYSIFNEYSEYARTYEPSYKIDGFEFIWPSINNFEVVEEFPLNSAMGSVALDDKLLRATYTDVYDGSLQQGLFAGSITNNPLGKESYTCYNAFFVSSPEDKFGEYKEVLLKTLNSIKYSDEFVSNTLQAIDAQTKNALAIGESLQATVDSCNKAWEERNTTYDIISQKQSDATLGYERVYDTETGDIYKVQNGFTDSYQGERLAPITDEMYALPIEGYLE